MPIASIVAALGGIKTATDIAKLIKDAGRSLESADHKLQIAELVSALADAKIALVEVQDTLYEKDENGEAIGSPYCSLCLEKHNLTVHINQNPKDRRYSVCPWCKSTFAWQRRITKDEHV